jgi:hypothetical protein
LYAPECRVNCGTVRTTGAPLGPGTVGGGQSSEEASRFLVRRCSPPVRYTYPAGGAFSPLRAAGLEHTPAKEDVPPDARESPLSASEEEADTPLTPRHRRNAPGGVDYSSDEVTVSSIGVIASVGDGGSVGVGADARSFGIGLWGPRRLRPSGPTPKRPAHIIGGVLRSKAPQPHRVWYPLGSASPCCFHRTLDGKRAGLGLRVSGLENRRPGKRRAGSHGNCQRPSRPSRRSRKKAPRGEGGRITEGLRCCEGRRTLPGEGNEGRPPALEEATGRV